MSGEGSYTTNHRNLSMRHEGQNHQGARILSNRPGVLRDKYQHSQNPHVKKQSNQLNDYQATSHLTRKLEASIEALENVRDAHVMSDGERIVIGLESSEQDRVRLIRAVEQEVEKITDLQQVTITTDRKIINRMNAVEHHVGLGKPFESISGAAGDLADLFDDAAHGRR
ncbi:YhcN/YlaJ family sporulation lipoprotein [Halalkalibacter wakoensis]|nr:YhcN/YlaJ family sporulation lipoprotein [Halalkalibacter wakoensis]